VGHVILLREIKHSYKILFVKSGRKGTLGKPSYRWENNIKMDLKEIWCEDMNWNHMA
jgi:hypothetical protein